MLLNLPFIVISIHVTFPRFRGFPPFSWQILGPLWIPQNRWVFIWGGGSVQHQVRHQLMPLHYQVSIPWEWYRLQKRKFYFSVNVVSLVLFKAVAETLGACNRQPRVRPDRGLPPLCIRIQGVADGQCVWHVQKPLCLNWRPPQQIRYGLLCWYHFI